MLVDTCSVLHGTQTKQVVQCNILHLSLHYNGARSVSDSEVDYGELQRVFVFIRITKLVRKALAMPIDLW